jgi:hypothetical protein
MINLLDYILDLFRDESQAQAFVANPDQALADAGLSTVSSAQLQSVAATAVPTLALSGGERLSPICSRRFRANTGSNRSLTSPPALTWRATTAS